ncbi:TELO2-interacting protein 1 homolog isoform X2 [Physella acuta]|uniref:TELO2-interacting protein 1 homolog isoform X2 n=1 Tax=Physella acuta TaxID=109671 RepID=UPI0027DC4600|nr:TELO2-interacting protein 1 homolog isoform X2 [Physella acuta]
MNDQENEKCEAVNELCPLTLALLKEITHQNARDLTSVLLKLNEKIIQELQSYIIFPIQVWLQTELSDTSLMTLCEILMAVLRKSKIVNLAILKSIFNNLIIRLTHPEQTECSRLHDSVKVSEQTALVVIETIIQLINVTCDKILDEFYILDNMPSLAQLITILLKIAKLEKSREYQSLALKCLLVLMQTNTKFGEDKAVELGNVFAHCLPGIVTGMVIVVKRDAQQGQGVIVKAIKVCQQILLLCMSDHLLVKCQVRQEDEKLKSREMQKKLSCTIQSLYIERSQKWVEHSSQNLAKVVDVFCSMRTHSNWRVRMSIVEFVELLLANCSKSLSNCFGTMLETLVGLSQDEYESISSKARSVLDSFCSSNIGTSGERTLAEILEENLFTLTASLPRLIKTACEENKISLIDLLNGYISLLGTKIKSVIYSTPHVRRFCLALIQILEIDLTDTKIMEQRECFIGKELFDPFHKISQQIWRPRKYFSHFKGDSILSKLISICWKLGKYGDLYILVDTFLELSYESATYQLSAIFIINELVLGTSSDKAKSNQGKQLLNDVINMLLQEYLAPANLEVNQPKLKNKTLANTEIVLQGTQDNKLVNKKQAIMLTCLFIEGIGKFATVLGDNFRKHLVRTLYPLIESLGNENVFINNTAYSSLVEVATACGYRSLDQLLQENSDYLVTSISKRLRHFHESSRAAQALCVMMRYCSSNMLYLIDYNISQIFESLDDSYTEGFIIFLPILLELVISIKRWFPEEKTKEEKISLPISSTLEVQDIVSSLNDYVKNKRILDDELSEEIVDLNAQQEASLKNIELGLNSWLSTQAHDTKKHECKETSLLKDDQRKTTPKHIHIIKEIFCRTRNLLSCQELRFRIMALDIIIIGSQVLDAYESEVLPLVHKIWPGMVLQFFQDETIITIKALKTLLELTKIAGEFLRQRILKEVLPILHSFMEKQAHASCEQTQSYHLTRNFKLQICVLTILGPIAKNMQLLDNELDLVLKVYLPYLNDKQPMPLQKAAMEAITSFICCSPDYMWLKLNQACTQEMIHPGEEFISIEFIPESDHITANIKKLLKLYDENKPNLVDLDIAHNQAISKTI